MAYISPINSTVTPLAASGVFTGSAESIQSYPTVLVNCKSDVAGTVYLDFSSDETHWDWTTVFHIRAGISEVFKTAAVAAFYRVRMINGSNAQSYLRLQTLLSEDTDLTSRKPSAVEPDAFGRARMAEPVTIFDSKQIHETQALFWDDQQISGSGTATSHSVNTASTTISVGNSTAGKRVRRTFQRFNYQPGKSQNILMTGQMVSRSSNLSGINCAIGQFDDNNGIYFSLESGTLYAVVRTKASGSVVNNKVAQSAWNLDPLDGTGISGITLDISKTQIFVFDYEWLGVGRVRFGFNIDGSTYYCHEFRNSNVLSVVYMSTPNLPLSYEIENTGSGAATSLQHICSTVISEGGWTKNGIIHAISNGTTAVTATTAGTYYALKGVRIKSTHPGETVIPESVNITITSSGTFEWQLRFNPTVAGTFTYSDVAGAGIQQATGSSSNTVTGGTVIAQGYGTSVGTGGGASGVAGTVLANALLLGQNIAGTMDTLVLCVTSLTNGDTFLGGITLRQLS